MVQLGAPAAGPSSEAFDIYTMAQFETLWKGQNERVSVMDSSLDSTNQYNVEGFTGLTVTSTLAQGGSSGDGSADIDLMDVLSGCMESQADVDQLTAGLLEMEDELKALVNDTSFLQFPSILQDIFSPESPDGEVSLHSGGTAAIQPSVSSEYLHPKERTKTQTESESITDHQAIAQHPLLPLISSILQKSASQTGELLSDSERTLLDTFKSKSERDVFMSEAVSLATQISEDKNSIGDLMQSIDNEGSYYTSEMSMFCRNLLQPDPVPTRASSAQIHKSIQTSVRMSNQNQPKGELAKENKPKIKSGTEGRKRVCLSKRSTQILREWLLEHADHPFPTDSEKDVLCLRTGLSLSKLNTWFVNSRRRVLAPLGLKNYHKEMTQLGRQ